jgi:arginine:ornithine antiporter/lysine permease
MVSGRLQLHARHDQRDDAAALSARGDQIFAGIAVVYTIFMFVAAGLKFVLLVTVLFAPGTILYVWARREQNARLFTPVELAIFVVVLIGAAIGIYGLVTGLITP